jgi:cytochrome P450
MVATSADSAPGAPATLDWVEPETWQDLHRHLGAAREQHPLARSRADGGWAVLRYADVDRLLRDERVESAGAEMFDDSGLDDGPFRRFVSGMLFTQNGEKHARLRSLVGRAFTPRSTSHLRPRIREIAHELVDAVEPRGDLEFVEEFAHHLPVRVISEMLGVPANDYPRFARWTSDLGLGFTQVFTPELVRTVDEAVSGLTAYVNDLVAGRRRQARDDLVSELVAAEEEGDRLSPEELTTMIVNLLFGGHDTTKSLLQIAVYTLLRHPEAWARLRDDPSGISDAVEEVLRFEPVVMGIARVARERLEVGGVAIEPGEELLLSLVSANRDPRRFPDADRFDPWRADQRHFGFGFGLHFCVGAALARAEAQEALAVLLERLPNLALDEAPRWRPYTAIRRFESLRVRF